MIAAYAPVRVTDKTHARKGQVGVVVGPGAAAPSGSVKFEKDPKNPPHDKQVIVELAETQVEVV